MRLLMPFILFLFPLLLSAQDITGLWTGYLQTMDNKLLYEVVISEQDRKLNGYALTVFIVNEVENQGVKTIKLKEKNGSYLLEDDELIFNNYTTPPQRVKLSGILTLTNAGSGMVLSGSFTTRSLDRRAMDTRPYSGTIYLQKQDPGKATRLMSRLSQMRLLNSLSFMQKQREKKPDLVVNTTPQKTEILKGPDSVTTMPVNPEPLVRQSVTSAEFPGILKAPWGKNAMISPKTHSITKSNHTPVAARRKSIVTSIPPPPAIEPPLAAAELTQRKTEVIRTILYSADSLVLTLYDNGTVDGDTVSVVLNGNVILPRKGLTTNAIRLVIPINPGQSDSLVLVMYAENLGSIPPNTGLLIIQDGDQRHEVRFAGDLQKSSAVVLRRKKGF